jgi:hypothetical protein
MTGKEAKDTIVGYVETHNGCKAIDMCLCEMLMPYDGELMELVDELVEEGRLIEVEYTLPQMPYRTKSFLFSAGTEINIRETPHKENINESRTPNR